MRGDLDGDREMFFSDGRRLNYEINRIRMVVISALIMLSMLSGPAFANAGEGLTYTDGSGITWQYTVLPEGGVSINGCDRIPESGRLEIPYEIDGKDVVRIGSGAFRGNNTDQKIKAVIIPDTVTVIKSAAFSLCYNLRNVTLSDNLVTIESNAFDSCPITEITFPDTLTTIGAGAFMESDLTSVTLPVSADFAMSNVAFQNCAKLTEFIAPANQPNYMTDDGIVYSKDGTALVAYPAGRSETSFTVPERVKTIKHGAFRWSKLQEIILPEGLTTIEDDAFYRCEKLTDITVPTGVESLGQAAFGYCTKLENVQLSEGLQSVGVGTFWGCTSLQTITLPDSVGSIGVQAFWGDSALKTIAIPDGVLSIGKETFQGAVALQSIFVPDSVSTIDATAFTGCSSSLVLYGTSVTVRDFASSSGYAFVSATRIQYEVIVTTPQEKPCQHSLKHRVAIEATCTQDGRVEYYYCTKCQRNFADSDAEHEIDTVRIPAAGHALDHVPAKAATEETEGNIEYWVCTKCRRVFTSEDGTGEVNADDTVLPKLQESGSNDPTEPGVDDPTESGGDEPGQTPGDQSLKPGAEGSMELPVNEPAQTPDDESTEPTNDDSPKIATEGSQIPVNPAIPANTEVSGDSDSSSGEQSNGSESQNGDNGNIPKTPSPQPGADTGTTVGTPEGPSQIVPVEQRILGTGKYVKRTGKRFLLDTTAKTKLSYRTTNKAVATVNSDGEVFVRGYGKCKIIVTAQATSEYLQAVRKITISAKLGKPVLKAKAKKGGKIKLSWGRVYGAKNYILYVKLPGQKKFVRAIGKSARVKSVTHRGLKAGATYTYKLRACTKVGKKIVYSPYSKSVKVKVRK